ncbi:hypothetical protein GW931_00255, partial [archaeon]|nr:hypothetical protein [archaeon]
MSKKLFVGNLDFKTTTEDLEKMFSEFGELEEVNVVTDRDTGRSKGFGFVTFFEDNEADKAISEMNEKEVNGRKINVNEAKEKEDRPERNSRERFVRQEREPQD